VEEPIEEPARSHVPSGQRKGKLATRPDQLWRAGHSGSKPLVECRFGDLSVLGITDSQSAVADGPGSTSIRTAC